MSTQSFVVMMPPEMMELRTRPLFAFQADVAKPSIIGLTPGHDRRVGVVTGGSFKGERLRGKILPGGSDWQSLRSDGTLTLDVRCIMETDDGHLIGMTYRGMRHGPKEVLERIGRGETVCPSEYYMRTAPFFETASEKYGQSRLAIAWLLGQFIRCSRFSDRARAVKPKRALRLHP